MNLIKRTLSLVIVLICLFYTNTTIAQGQGVSENLLEEYETLIQKCFDINGNPTEVKADEVKRIEDIYTQMSSSQKETATKISNIVNNTRTRKKNPFPEDAVYYVDGEESTAKDVLEIIEQGKFKIVRKKVGTDYEFHIELLE